MNFTSIKILCFVIFIYNVTLNCSAQNKILYINQYAIGSNTGESWNNAFTSFDSLFFHLDSLTEVWIAKGIYTGSLNVNWYLNGQNLSIYGGFEGSETSIYQRDFSKNKTIISGEKRYNVLFLRNGNYTLNGLILEKGYANGLQFNNGDIDCTYWGPEEFMCKGGGIYIYSQDTLKPCRVILKNCIIRNNSAIEGGGIYVNSYPAGICGITIDSSIISSNVANDNTGGIKISLGISKQLLCSIRNSDIVNNSAYLNIGGLGYWSIYDSFSNIIIENCRFIKNTALLAGGASINNGSKKYFEIRNCQFIENKATNKYGGGTSALNLSYGKVDHCIFLNNTTYVNTVLVKTSDFTNCLFAKNKSFLPNSNILSTIKSTIPLANECSNFYNCSFFDDSKNALNLFDIIEQKTNFNNCSFYARDTNIKYFNVIYDSLNFKNCSFNRRDTSDNFINKLYSPNLVIQSNCLWNFYPDYQDTTVNNFRLTSCSPLINKGSNEFIYKLDSFDLNGSERVQDSIIDIGAYETFKLNYSYTLIPNVCFNDSVGKININATGGIPPYSVIFKNNIYNLNSFINIPSGVQNISLIDSTNCKITFTESFGPENLKFDTLVKNASSNISADGGIHLQNFKGGNPPLKFNWSNGSADSFLINLLYGTYKLTITDATECSSTFEFIVNYPTKTKEPNSLVKYLLIPNPAKEYFLFEPPMESPVELNIYNNLGVLISYSKLYKGEKINISSIQPGIYYVAVKNSEIHQILKMIKE